MLNIIPVFGSSRQKLQAQAGGKNSLSAGSQTAAASGFHTQGNQFTAICFNAAHFKRFANLHRNFTGILSGAAAW